MKEQPNYYAILTADVRYSKQINANEKLLYAEITALTHKEGYCWASNDYFAELYSCTPQAISKWIKNLKDNGFISCNYIYKEGSKEIQKRVIRLSSIGINNGLTGINNDTIGINTELKGYQHTIKDNNTSYNNINNNSLVGSSQTPTKKDSNIGKSKDQLIDFDALLVLFNNITGKKFRVINKKARKQFLDILNEGYTKVEIKEAIINCFSSDYHKDNPQYLTPEFISRMEKFEKYVFATHKKQVLPSDFWVRELSDEQKKLLSDKDLATWERQKTARLMEGGRMLPIKIEYEK